jgi:hypothetical protein
LNIGAGTTELVLFIAVNGENITLHYTKRKKAIQLGQTISGKDLL